MSVITRISKGASAATVTVLAFVVACLLATSAQAAEGIAAQSAPSVSGTTQASSLVPQKSVKALNKMIMKTGQTNLKKTVKKYDVTGDGKADKLTIKFVKSSLYSEWVKEIRVYVNGKLAWRDHGDYESWAFRSSSLVKYMRTTSGVPFLLVKCTANNGDGNHDVLRYRKGKLVSVASNANLPKGYGNHQHIENAAASGKYVKVKYAYMTYTAGSVRMTYKYKPKSGLAKRTSATTSAVAYYTGSSFGKSFMQVRSSVQAYTTASLKKAKFTVGAYDYVKIDKACIKSGKLAFRITTDDGKVGWFGALKQGLGMYGGDTLLVGTGLAG